MLGVYLLQGRHHRKITGDVLLELRQEAGL